MGDGDGLGVVPGVGAGVLVPPPDWLSPFRLVLPFAPVVVLLPVVPGVFSVPSGVAGRPSLRLRPEDVPGGFPDVVPRPVE